MLRVSAHTFGCKLNQSETEAALSILADFGYQLVPWEAGADLYLINTCTVTSKGEQKARRLIRQVQQRWPQAVVLAAGCYAVLERQRLEALGDRVCALPDQPAQLCTLLAEQDAAANSDELLSLLRTGIQQQTRDLRAGVARSTDFPQALMTGHQGLPQPRPAAAQRPAVRPACGGGGPLPDLLPAPERRPPRRRQRYLLKIQDGCNRTCSFCRIRIARGPSRSLGREQLIAQLQGLEAQGYSEAVITGVHINSYRDVHNGRESGLGELLLALLEHTHSIRLRLSSLEPEALESTGAHQLWRALASRRLCAHFHISVQSGSEYVLRQMRRGYTAGQQRRYLQALRQLRPEAFLSADVIAGFPGEREEDFQATLSLLEQVPFSAVHAFSYSPRPGTAAYDMPSLTESVVKQRMGRLLELGCSLHRAYLTNCLGRQAEVLLEELRDGYWFGYSENYVRTRIRASESWQAGDVVRVQLARPEHPTDQTEAQTNGDDSVLEGVPALG